MRFAAFTFRAKTSRRMDIVAASIALFDQQFPPLSSGPERAIVVGKRRTGGGVGSLHFDLSFGQRERRYGCKDGKAGDHSDRQMIGIYCRIARIAGRIFQRLIGEKQRYHHRSDCREKAAHDAQHPDHFAHPVRWCAIAMIVGATENNMVVPNEIMQSTATTVQ